MTALAKKCIEDEMKRPSGGLQILKTSVLTKLARRGGDVRNLGRDVRNLEGSLWFVVMLEHLETQQKRVNKGAGDLR